MDNIFAYNQCPFYQGATYATSPFCIAYNEKGCWESSLHNCEIWAIIYDKTYLHNSKCSEVARFLHDNTTKEERISMQRQGNMPSPYFLEECENKKEAEKKVKYTR